MADVNSKSTKAEILKAYEEAQKRLELLGDGLLNPKEEVEKKEVDRAVHKADEAILEDVLSPEILGTYKDVKVAIEAKNKELEELYGVEAELQKITVSINAGTETKRKLQTELELAKQEHTERLARLDEEFTSRKTELMQREANLIEENNKIRKEEKAELLKQRSREEEEYRYEFERKKMKENDAWEEEKKAREEELAAKELELEEKIKKFSDTEAEFDELKAKVAEIPELLAEAEKSGSEKGKAEASKEWGFAKRSLESNMAHSQELYDMKIENLEKQIKSLETEKEQLSRKLDSAYTEMKELASKVAESSQIKVMNGSDSYNKK